MEKRCYYILSIRQLRHQSMQKPAMLVWICMRWVLKWTSTVTMFIELGSHLRSLTVTSVCFFQDHLFPRRDSSLRNSVGVLDSGYRGEVIFKFAGNSSQPVYDVGDRIGQIIVMPYPQIEFEMVKELNETDR